jgi:hypothetical protein
VVSAALEAAVATVKNDQGDDMSGWSKEAENIVFDALGAGSVDEIPWQNRGTQITWSRSSRPRRDSRREAGSPAGARRR